MGRASNKLSTLEVKKDLPPGLYGDGDGLYLQVSNLKTKAWVFRFMMAGTARKMGLGSVDRVTLADARKKAKAAYSLVQDGVDPIDAREAKRSAEALEKAKVVTFKACAEKYIAAHEAGWKSEKHGAQWAATLERYANPVIGHLSVASIDVGLVLKVIEPIWSIKTETANRIRGRIESILDWARARGLRTGENPARWRGHLDQLLPARSSVAPVKNHKALPYTDLPRFMAALRQRDSVSARALEYTILTVARTGDTIGGIWAEIDPAERLWTVPAARVKGKKGARKRDHVVPLSDRAFDLLEAMPREGEFIFPGAKEKAPLSNMAMLEFLQGMGFGEKLTVHGFRSAFKDWCSDRTAYPNELSEMALAHTVSDKVEAAYRRGDMREKRRRLMADWAEFCASSARGVSANVVALRAAP
jgi:integrase